MKSIERAGVIEAVESGGRGRKERLKAASVPRSTYYRWKGRYTAEGTAGLERKGGPEGSWTQLTPEEDARALEVALANPELSPRLLSVRLLDEEGISVSESTLFRRLKERGLIEPRPLDDMPAAKEWKHKTTGPDQIYQCDGVSFFVAGYGYYKGIPVADDWSRKIMAMPVKPDESSNSISDAVEEALETAKREGHKLDPKPDLLSDNGPGFIGDVLSRYLAQRGIRHIFGHPYHPQTQGKVEAINKKIKGRVKMLVYCSPEALAAAVAEAVKIHNATPREALKNVSPNDAYAGRMEEILKRRAELKRLALQKRKEYNQARRLESQKLIQGKVSQNG